MKAYDYLFVVLVLSTVAANDGFAAQAQASRNEGRPGASGKAVATNGGHPARGQAPKHGGLPGAVSKTRGGGARWWQGQLKHKRNRNPRRQCKHQRNGHGGTALSRDDCKGKLPSSNREPFWWDVRRTDPTISGPLTCIENHENDDVSCSISPAGKTVS